MWTEERIETLKSLWAVGHSASEIAGRLGGITRNAVIGKVHRLGLAGRKTESRMRARRSSARRQPPASPKSSRSARQRRGRSDNANSI